jgi:hypothetical protein
MTPEDVAVVGTDQDQSRAFAQDQRWIIGFLWGQKNWVTLYTRVGINVCKPLSCCSYVQLHQLTNVNLLPFLQKKFLNYCWYVSMSSAKWFLKLFLVALKHELEGYNSCINSQMTVNEF